MRFNEYAVNRDEVCQFESAGLEKSQVALAVAAMRQYAEATTQLIAALENIPETQGSIGGSAFGLTGQPDVGENTIGHAVALELQRSKHVIQEAGLADVASKMTQFSSRVHSAFQQITEGCLNEG